VDSVEISTDKGMRIRLSKTPQQRGVVSIPAPSMVTAGAIPAVAQPTPPNGVPAVADAGAGAPGTAGTPNSAEPTLLEVKSPMVGTFYSAPEPGAKPYVAEGDRIAKGQILCIIEAMKIMNEIESEFAGTLREVQASDAHPVEYGQVLFRIEPHG
jgi:acetyl-CoA carboxylase biotin carboxyl carrier protein